MSFIYSCLCDPKDRITQNSYSVDVKQSLSYKSTTCPLESTINFDENLWSRHYAAMDGLEAARSFHAMRGWNLAFFRRLAPAELASAAAHPQRGPETADTVIRIMAGHTLNHLAQLETILAAS